MTIPTTAQIVAQNIARFESFLGQKVPINPKSFLRVLSTEEAVLFTTLYKYAINRAKQNLAITATNGDLDIIGTEYGVTRKIAVATVLTATLPGVNGTIIPATVDFVSDSTGIRYANNASVTIGTPTSGVAELTLTAKTTGVIGNLQAGDTMTIGYQIAGAETGATVAVITGYTSEIITTGTDEEADDEYRIRILDVIRAPGGGGNAADYRNWSQEVDGVARAYPYAGKPAALLLTSDPPDRTVYVEATTSIDPDGIPTSTILDAVRDSITTDPVTGISRQPLGLTDDTLYVEAITRTAFYVQITGLVVQLSLETQAKADIETALAAYFLSLRPFVEGVDAIIERNDLITDLTVSDVVQDVLKLYAGSAQSVAFDIVSGGSLPEYQLGQGELAKLAASGGVTYV